jgi:hypothetical protein
MYQITLFSTYSKKPTIHFEPVVTAEFGNFSPRTMDKQGNQQQTFIFILPYLQKLALPVT